MKPDLSRKTFSTDVSDKLHIVPIFQKAAFAFVEENHRHHKKPVGSVFQIACSNGNKIVGVAIVGRPNGRRQQDGYTLEVTRLCTDGSKNVCSLLYAACWRIAKEMGYKRLLTYILSSEPGTSLKAVGWKRIGLRGGGSWSVPSRQRQDKHPLEKKVLYQKT